MLNAARFVLSRGAAFVSSLGREAVEKWRGKDPEPAQRAIVYHGSAPIILPHRGGKGEMMNRVAPFTLILLLLLHACDGPAQPSTDVEITVAPIVGTEEYITLVSRFSQTTSSGERHATIMINDIEYIDQQLVNTHDGSLLLSRMHANLEGTEHPILIDARVAFTLGTRMKDELVLSVTDDKNRPIASITPGGTHDLKPGKYRVHLQKVAPPERNRMTNALAEPTR